MTDSSNQPENPLIWKDAPEEKHYQASKDFLSLIYPTTQVSAVVTRLRANAIRHFKAKDIIRASGLTPLLASNANVQKNLRKIGGNIALTPVLLVQDSVNGKVIIADGYHRTSAVYIYDEDCEIACKITNLQGKETAE